MLDNMAEVYVDHESGPILLIEYDKVFNVNFRCDMTSAAVAELMYDMSVITGDIVIGKDFFNSPDGLLYGDQAMASYFASIMQAFEAAQLKQEADLDDSVFLVKDPIYAYNDKRQYKDKVQRLWGTED